MTDRVGEGQAEPSAAELQQACGIVDPARYYGMPPSESGELGTHTVFGYEALIRRVAAALRASEEALAEKQTESAGLVVEIMALNRALATMTKERDHLLICADTWAETCRGLEDGIEASRAEAPLTWPKDWKERLDLARAEATKAERALRRICDEGGHGNLSRYIAREALDAIAAIRAPQPPEPEKT